MYKWRPFKELRTLLNTALDETLHFALLAQQAVPWLP
jgi:hypothetical protein